MTKEAVGGEKAPTGSPAQNSRPSVADAVAAGLKLIAATEAGKLAEIRRLLPMADLSAKNGEGQTALTIAARLGQEEAMRALLLGSEPLEKDNAGKTALDHVKALAFSLKTVRMAEDLKAAMLDAERAALAVEVARAVDEGRRGAKKSRRAPKKL